MIQRLSVLLILALSCQILFAQGKITRQSQTTTTKTAKSKTTTSKKNTVQAKKTSQEEIKLSVSGSHVGHDYVDLGLPSGRLWATCNIGSNSPSGYGDYFAWGETSTKKLYSRDNYTGCKDIKSDELAQFCNGNIIGNCNYDAAAKNWGALWELPSRADFGELHKECKWICKSIDGHKGYLITGPNGNTIFLPMAGLINGDSKAGADSTGYYWVGGIYSYHGTFFIFRFNESVIGGLAGESRYKGLSIRPVVKSVLG